jgi:uncharacterized protein with HEPN domain
MQLEALKYLYDMHEAAGLASQFTDSKSFADYQQNTMLRMAVERACSIIGEALSQLARVDSATAGKISDFRSIVAFRNILVHTYGQVDDHIVWDIVQSKLPVLVREVAELMEEGESSRNEKKPGK